AEKRMYRPSGARSQPVSRAAAPAKSPGPAPDCNMGSGISGGKRAFFSPTGGGGRFIRRVEEESKGRGTTAPPRIKRKAGRGLFGRRGRAFQGLLGFIVLAYVVQVVFAGRALLMAGGAGFLLFLGHILGSENKAIGSEEGNQQRCHG